MELKENIARQVNRCLKEPGKKTIHHIALEIPGHEGRYWIINSHRLFAETTDIKEGLTIYFSVNRFSKKGKQLLDTISLLDVFEGYETDTDGLHSVFFRITDNQAGRIAEEIQKSIGLLFPTLDSANVMVKNTGMEEWNEEEE